MKNKILLWLPRILSIIFTCFLLLFSFDVFDMAGPWWLKVGAFFIHSIPSIVLAIVVIVSWKREIVGGIVFILAGLTYIILTIMSDGLPWYLALSWSITLAGPAILTGCLFLLNWHKKRKI